MKEKKPDDNENENEKADGQVDEYEISEMKECLNTGGQLKKSPSVRSVVSVDSLNQAGKLQNGGNNDQDWSSSVKWNLWVTNMK